MPTCHQGHLYSDRSAVADGLSQRRIDAHRDRSMQGALRRRSDNQTFEQLDMIVGVEQAAFDQLEVTAHAEARVLLDGFGHAATLAPSNGIGKAPTALEHLYVMPGADRAPA